jgi:hypothetical protein
MVIQTDEIGNGGEERQTASPEPERTPVRKSEDTVDGCRAMASADRARADAVSSDQMRSRLERSAQAWASRADMFEGIERRLNERRNADDGADGADAASATEKDDG